jgi:hypothetical protein
MAIGAPQGEKRFEVVWIRGAESGPPRFKLRIRFNQNR